MGQLGPVVVVIIVLAIVMFRARTTHFECPNCGHSFKVSGPKYALTFHVGFNRYVTCPNCNKGAMMTPMRDE